MGKLKFCAFIFVLFFLAACEKETPEVVPQEQKSEDYFNLSFEINGRTYTCEDEDGIGWGNRQINIKPFDKEISGRRFQYQTGNYFWYGEKDSTLYEVMHHFSSDKERNRVNIFFTRKFHNNQLKKALNLPSIPEDNTPLFLKGKQGFALDYGKENTVDGIALDMYLAGFTDGLTSYYPGFSILVKPDLNKDLQNNSTFEIIQVDKIGTNHLLVQARFELNLYDESGKLYRLENGLLKFATFIKLVNPSYGP